MRAWSGSCSLHVDQFRTGRAAQNSLQILLADRMDGVQQLIRKFAAYHCSNLNDLPVDPTSPSASHGA